MRKSGELSEPFVPQTKETNLDYLGSFIVKILAVLAYISIALTSVIFLFQSKGCFVRHSYYQESLLSFSNNGMYNAMHVVRSPPGSMAGIVDGLTFRDTQRYSDIAAFPVTVENPVRDAAFWPVVFAPPETLDSALQNAPGGSLEDMLRILSDGGQVTVTEVTVNGTTTNVTSIGNSTLVADGALKIVVDMISERIKASMAPPVTPSMDPMDVQSALYGQVLKQFEMSKPGQYVITTNGTVQANGIFLDQETYNFLTSLRTQSLQSRGIAGILPNVGRCAPPMPAKGDLITDTAAEKLEFRHWLERLATIASNSHLRGSCVLSGQHQVVDVTTNYKTSALPFSSTNPIFMMYGVIWVTTSFAVFSLVASHAPMKWWEEGKSGVLMGGIVVIVVWHLICFSLALASFEPNHVPMNNLIMVIVMIVVSLIVQANYYFYHKSELEKGSGDNDGTKQGVREKPRYGYSAPDGPPPASADGTIMVSPWMIPSGLGAPMMITNRHGGGMSSSSSVRTAAVGEYTNDAVYMHAIDAKGVARKVAGAGKSVFKRAKEIDIGALVGNYISEESSVEMLRFIEYAITTPILGVSVLAAYSPSCSNQWLLIVYVSTLVFYLIGVASMSLFSIYKIPNPDNTIDRTTLWEASVMLIIPGIFSVVPTLWVYISSVTTYATSYQPDGMITAAAALFITAQLLFVLLFLISMVLSPVLNEGTYNCTDWLYPILYVFINIIIKFFVPLLVIISSNNNTFPEHQCLFWADIPDKLI